MSKISGGQVSQAGSSGGVSTPQNEAKVELPTQVPVPKPRPRRSSDTDTVASSTSTATAFPVETYDSRRALARALDRGQQRQPARDSNYYFKRSGGTVREYTVDSPSSPNAPTLDLRGGLDSISDAGKSVTRFFGKQLDKVADTVRDVADGIESGVHRADRTDLTSDAERLARDGGRIIEHAPSGDAATVTKAARSINRTMAELTDLVPRGSHFDVNLPYPVTYTDRNGSMLYFPKGSRVVADNGAVKLFSAGAYAKAGNILVETGEAELNLGSRENLGRFDRLRVDTKNVDLDVQGVTTRLQADGATRARAESIAIDLTSGSLRATGVQLDVPNSETLTASADSLAVQTSKLAFSTGKSSLTETTRDGTTSLDGAARALDVTRGSQRLTADSMSFNLTQRSGGQGALSWQGEGVNFNDGTNQFGVASAALSFTKRADGSTLHMQSRDLVVRMQDRSFTSTGNATFDMVYDRKGRLTDATGRATSIAFNDGSTNLAATGTRLHARFDSSGQLTSLDGGADKFNLALRDGSKLAVDRGTVAISREGNDILARARAAGGTYTNSSGTYTLGTNSALDMRITPEVIAIAGSTDTFSAHDGKTQLDVTNGRVDATFGRTTDAQSIKLTGDEVRYVGTNSDDGLSRLDVKNASADITRAADGAMTVALAGTDVGMDVSGNQIALENARDVRLATDASGRITSIDMSLLGKSSLTSKDGNTLISGTNIDAHYDGVGETIRGTFDQAGFTLRNLGLTGTLNGGALSVSPNALSASVASGDVARTTGTTFSGNFTRFGLDATTNDAGQLTSADGRIGTFDGRIGSTAIRVNNREGESVTLQTRWDGNLRDAILNIPDGGSVVVDTNDAHLRLGEQSTRLTYDGVDTWNLRSTNFHADGVMDGVSVKATGEIADVSLSNGSIFINQIRSTNVQAEGKGWDVNVDMKKVDDVIAHFSGVSGAATGASLMLTPSSDRSNVTARVTGSASGIPFSLDVSNAKSLDAYALVQPNQARFAVNDPSGQGDIKVNVGKVLTMESVNGQLGAVLTYNQYDAGRMAQQLTGLVGTLPVGNGDHLRINPSGTIQTGFLGMPDEGHLGGRLGFTVNLPRHVNDPRFEPFDSTAPLVPNRTFGVLVEAGIAGTTQSGSSTMVGLHAGALPGSTLQLDVQGSASLFGKVPLPNHVEIPTTAVAGVSVEHKTRNGPAFNVLTGVQFNGASLAPKEYATENARLGAYTAVGVRGDNWQVSAGATVMDDKSYGGMVRFGMSF